MARVVVTRRLPDGGLDPLLAAGHDVETNDADEPRSPDALRAAAADADAIVCLLTDRIDADVLAAGAGRLRVVANVAVGYDNIDVAAAAAAGVAVCNTPGVLDETVADLAFALILAASRLTGDAASDLRAGRWPGWGILQYLGRDVHGATLGLVGYGRIARAVARRASGFGMQLLHHARHDTGNPGFVADLDRLLAESDVVSLHVPLTPETHHLLDARRLALLRPTAVLVNTARGPSSTRRRSPRRSSPGRCSPPGSTSTRTSRASIPGCSPRRAPCCCPTSARRPRPPAPAWPASPATASSPCSPGSGPPTS